VAQAAAPLDVAEAEVVDARPQALELVAGAVAVEGQV
jgi:hypothetical protein